MNLKKHYDLLMAKAKDRQQIKGYVEIHHIIPRSYGGSDLPENLVNLTFREHFLAHWILFRIAKNTDELIKMGKAFGMMRRSPHSERVLTSIMFERAKTAARKAQSLRMTGTTSETSAMRRDMNREAARTLSDKTIYHWYHVKFGDYECTASDLYYEFPDQGLISGNLLKVGRGMWGNSNGWVLYENRDNYETILNVQRTKGAGIGGSIGGNMKHVTNGIENTRVFEVELDKFLEDNPGWRRGSLIRKPREKGYVSLYSSDGKTRARVIPGDDRYKSLMEQGYWAKSGLHGIIPPEMKGHKANGF